MKISVNSSLHSENTTKTYPKHCLPRTILKWFWREDLASALCIVVLDLVAFLDSTAGPWLVWIKDTHRSSLVASFIQDVARPTWHCNTERRVSLYDSSLSQKRIPAELFSQRCGFWTTGSPQTKIHISNGRRKTNDDGRKLKRRNDGRRRLTTTNDNGRRRRRRATTGDDRRRRADDDKWRRTTTDDDDDGRRSNWVPDGATAIAANSNKSNVLQCLRWHVFNVTMVFASTPTPKRQS